jgi:hypothetical protein
MHTPGPWKIEWKGSGGCAIVSADGHGKVGNVLVRYSKTDNLAEVKGNATLIAACPELLKALKEQIEPRAKGWKVTDWDIRDEYARAAIAKAEATR